MAALGKALQLLGLVVVPMGLLYYFTNQGRMGEAKLMFGELAILAFGATCFVLGRAISRSGQS
ncbi:MAG: hypothetical protein HY721_08280 [Planctomycetes bacterium]|nr:hypothetical protein [Planctomycetota bacterium]